MPEIWLNYGVTDVVLDIRAENLGQQIKNTGKTLTDEEISSKLNYLDISKPLEIAVLQNSNSIKKFLTKLFEKCEEKSVQLPRIMAEKKLVNFVKEGLPEGSVVTEFDIDDIPNSNLVFLDEIEFDGLFGFETVSTKLLKKFGKDEMLSAYEKRKGNLPTPGINAESFNIANKFADNFEIIAIEINSNSEGIVDISIEHPSKTSPILESFTSSAKQEIDKQRTLIISSGKSGSNNTFSKSLTSIWNCNEAVRDDGLAILIGECSDGIGSEAVQQYIDGRLTLERLKHPSKYFQGMEDLLYLTEIQKRINIGLVSVLPQFYVKKLNIKSFGGIKQVMDYIIKSQGVNQKVSVVSDGYRILLR
jgi:hypothetical protein